ncbi:MULTISPECIES: thiol:disulfide interchange protein DsbA/DsbL [Xanthomonas]|jgi:thiol:disulfide interchange protein DsbA|uniref:Thiol:disulfide interchange protein n=3 Tax=Xanthomonas campestris pv. campestris TaxID=340 RepID=Q8P5E2_XANCP|nr:MULTISPECIES: thiol:disulfide interchange protein DsbA/DsbL [Xanthomonas]AAM42669.1 disulfide oxidoreductase [Xanthomonas campestris pv. campestris str. ATCC 33913]AAY47843.1 disulfide oxidoreductase [Xanthomonas campestris pv. campestris str. 8004]AEL08597.1 disulfide oxidoreductase [Xanthomonas campestris pv. raphani 756C]AKS15115.1 dihydroneopterin aldolase [Xanthomonas campestris pv. campestris]AKS19144.1 dihydroneopterin aldolase [Xanthomonas campestris pv. campestris]
MNLFSRLSLLLLILLPLAACAADKKAPPVEGEDYVLIDGGQPYAPLAGKVEVAEVFGYTCPHCAHFEPTLEAWTAKQPAYVRVTPVPAAFGGFWDAFARAYFAADTLGVAKRSHRAMFDAIHEKHTVPTQNVAPEELAAFYVAYGVPQQRFIDTLKSAAVEDKVKAAREFATRAKIPGTPALVVNGRYLITARDYTDMLRVADYLIAREHAAPAAR